MEFKKGRTGGLIIIMVAAMVGFVLAGPAWANVCETKYAEIRERILSGGPPKDGIPAIDDPKYLAGSESDLADEAQVIGLDFNGFVAAYPLKIMVWHEIVNEEINGQKISLTFCPLTGTAIGYLGYNLGVSGKLYNSNLVMYDRATDSIAPQITGRFIAGERCDEDPKFFPLTVTTWKQWREKHPRSLVLSTQTGHARDYTRDPYADYYQSPKVWFPLTAESQALNPKEIVLGIEHQGRALAVVKKDFNRNHPQGLEVRIGDLKLKLTYDPDLNRIVPDKEVKHFEGYWFAWYAFHPQTELKM